MAREAADGVADEGGDVPDVGIPDWKPRWALRVPSSVARMSTRMAVWVFSCCSSSVRSRRKAWRLPGPSSRPGSPDCSNSVIWRWGIDSASLKDARSWRRAVCACTLSSMAGSRCCSASSQRCSCLAFSPRRTLWVRKSCRANPVRVVIRTSSRVSGEAGASSTPATAAWECRPVR